MNVENTSEFDEDSDMSEISVEDEVDCSEFLQSEPKPEKDLISENYVEFDRMSKDKSKVFKEKAVIYQKVQTVPNQVYATTGVTKKQIVELTSLVNKDNADGCEEYFWLAPIDNANETVGLSERTSWRVKGRYVAEPLNKPSSFDKPSSSGTKEIQRVPIKESRESSSIKSKARVERPKPKANIHKS